MRSVAIHHPADPTRPKTIRADRFNPKIHRLWREDVADDAEGVDTEAGADPQGRDAERADEPAGGVPAGHGQGLGREVAGLDAHA